MSHLLSIDNVFFTFLGYRMSYLEFFGTVLNILSVWLVVRKNIWTWPVGIVAVILFGILFYQIQLYSDLIEQVYYLVTGFYGWWIWLRYRSRGVAGPVQELPVSCTSGKVFLVILLAVVFGTLGLGSFMKDVHIYLPDVFSVPASFPYLDAFTTVTSFAAQLLLAHKKVESWFLWIAVDVIGVWLYYVKDVKFVALLYLVFLFLAIRGWRNWTKELEQYTRW